MQHSMCTIDKVQWNGLPHQSFNCTISQLWQQNAVNSIPISTNVAVCTSSRTPWHGLNFEPGRILLFTYDCDCRERMRDGLISGKPAAVTAMASVRCHVITARYCHQLPFVRAPALSKLNSHVQHSVTIFIYFHFILFPEFIFIFIHHII